MPKNGIATNPQNEDDPVARRQEALRTVINRISNAGPVAGVFVTLQTDGSLRTAIAGLEPEQIDFFLAAIAELSEKMIEHKATAKPTTSEGASVIHLTF
jgi:hypothetical protein